MHNFIALSVCLVVTSDRTHTGIRRTVSLHSEHVYKDKFWVEMSVKIYSGMNKLLNKDILFVLLNHFQLCPVNQKLVATLDLCSN